ncbi:hypothetical conserved protein [Novosphingobium sp. MBES04]|nr:hypothetical conserved protein [Novosphingobium sp. MBES04]
MPELAISLSMIIVMLLVARLFGLTVIFPSGERAAFVGIHYIYPLIGVGALGLVTFFIGNRAVSSRFLVALPCYAAVLFVHFNMKLWIPHINPYVFDDFYWGIDQFFRPIVELCFVLRKSVFAFIPSEANFYMIAYIALFYTSFLYHALKTPAVFGKLIVAALLLQAFGTFAYLVAPAVGPFIYETGVNPIITSGQESMLSFYRQSVAEGPQFLVERGGINFTAGLAAMPSLHTAGAFLFFLVAWKHGKVLIPLYAFILTFIVVTAVASRWHYLVDIPVGMLLAWTSYRLANRLDSGLANAPAAGEAHWSDPLPS